ncbi:MAG: hypothetical protein Q8R26_01810 [bacterium]|nr:hypothetical protein [bacterium]
MLKVLVATKELSGRTLRSVPPHLARGGYRSSLLDVPEGELVLPLVCWEVLRCHNDDWCHLTLGGVKTLTKTTNFKVIERPLTLKELEGKFFVSIKSQGYVGDRMLKFPLLFWQEVARRFAEAIVRVTSKFPVNDVLSKNSCMFWSRKNPQRRVKIIVTYPRKIRSLNKLK